MDEQNGMTGFNPEGILQGILANPQLLAGAMELASKLSASSEGMGKAPPASETADGTASANAASASAASASTAGAGTASASASIADSASSPSRGHASSKRSKVDMARHKKLLEALSLYVSEEKRGKLAFIVKVLDLWELAESMGLLGG